MKITKRITLMQSIETRVRREWRFMVTGFNDETGKFDDELTDPHPILCLEEVVYAFDMDAETMVEGVQFDLTIQNHILYEHPESVECIKRDSCYILYEHPESGREGPTDARIFIETDVYSPIMAMLDEIGITPGENFSATMRRVEG